MGGPFKRRQNRGERGKLKSGKVAYRFRAKTFAKTNKRVGASGGKQQKRREQTKIPSKF